MCCAMAPKDTFPLADRALGGTLSKRLNRWHREGKSLHSISALLRDEGVDVSTETVRRWCTRVGIDTSRSTKEPAA